MSTLWDGNVTKQETLLEWKETVRTYTGAVAVGSKGRLYVFPRLGAARPLCIKLQDESLEVHCAAWALTDVPGSVPSTDPLIIFTASSLIFILNVKTHRVIGQLRGHGGPITCLTVHPSHPELFCTTSRDFTARIYDLTCFPIQEPNNMHWPPATHPSLAGPAHGLQMTEPEGEGIGQCLAVFVGGRSGGHRGAVLSAAFHRSEPLLATCGMDRAVKIWRIPPLRGDVLAREDKPLFSTDFIHKARVLSIAWLSHDTLISHCAPAPMRKSGSNEIYYENGTVVIWRWLGFDRFFPPGRLVQTVMRGCASDWRGSESFKIISAYFLPMTTLKMHVHQRDGCDPLIVVPMGKVVRIINLTDFGPRAIPPFPLDAELNELTQRMQLTEPPAEEQTAQTELVADEGDDQTTARGQAEVQDHQTEAGDGLAGDEEAPQPRYDYEPSPEAARLTELFDSVQYWELGVDAATSRCPDLPDITACEIAFEGRAILGVGDGGVLYIWRRSSS